MTCQSNGATCGGPKRPLTRKTTEEDCQRRIRQVVVCRLLPVCCLLISLFLGCGKGEYERRLGNRGNRLRQKFQDLYAAQQLPGTPVSIRMPQIFKDSPLVEGALLNGKPVDVRRVKPENLVTIPGLRLTYEGFVENADGGKQSYYCYVGALASTTNQVPDLCDNLRKALAAKAPYQVLSEWEDAEVETSEGLASQWKRLQFVGNQAFLVVDRAGQQQFKTMPGGLTIYLQEVEGYLVVIVWRTPTAIWQQVNVDKLAPLVAGCVSVKK